jgi:hypothetical protein
MTALSLSRNPLRLRTALLAAVASLTMRAAGAVTITDPGQGVFDFTASAAELSGLTWLFGTTYHAVGDDANQRKAYELNIGVNPTNGRITGASLVQTITLSTGYDLEGIAYCRPRGTWFVSDEGQHPAGGFIREHTLPDGNLVGNVTIPTPMQNDRANFGLESCSWGAGALWTANEEALAQESALSTASTGSIIRLQKFDHLLNAAGQWAYQTDSFGFDNPGIAQERSGVSDLLALPDGNLLVLERTLGVGLFTSYRNRIYLVNFTGATDVSSIADLDGAVYTPVTKTLLWERNMGSVQTRNFEGIALGPALPALGSNSYSVLLVADNGGGTQQHLYALIVNGVVAPSPLAQWRQGFWGTTAAIGPSADDADPDGDGLVNRLEYALNGNPHSSAQTPLPQSNTAGGSLAITFTRNITNTDITIIVQAADALDGSWTDFAQSVNGAPTTALIVGVAVTETGSGATRSVEVRDIHPIGDPAHPRRFMRVKAIGP